ncbi:MAG: thiosulfate-binding protein SoxY [Chlorobium sp.]|jgi:sulfur-oxidizing protein SoxY|uniref:thiosulfate oxidation carrier protein SoxY n=1 Tax=Chlorobium sp. TaxID=1095 RepID=UPI001DA98A66|nr:thiosulfate oxidation carrier protein SoxY [Chlorobium sp.]MBN1278334.1 thiosulfate-binding protein SoxY [Chlorobiaceae bacterium]MCF8216335.1 thiosulfate-binding protein SoxY [Chlorobium sp.]MCF8271237.1 thiosulfate-binding protein SoxY [Chlorobium sp.]MCF8287611.1 thiosulfate-binding protein SoxY [Chlorobium sp.]MCF8291150.1 thiosulfate-binding protein SoxY [Chlorobium sp.]
MKRRSFLARSIAAAFFVLLRPSQVIAAWNAKHFQQIPIEKAFIEVLGTADMVRTDRIVITVPEVASDSSAVPVAIDSDLKGEAIYLFVEKNITPLAFSCYLHEGVLPAFSLNIKMKESSLLYAVVKESGKYYMASVQVTVSAQAC